MYCPNCNKEFEGKFCPECGTKLVEKPAGGFNINLGDANAISGGIQLSDSHAIHNEDKSVHNTSNVNNVMHNTTQNITQVAAQKTEIEILQERKKQYLNACNRAYEDNVLDPEEKNNLDRLRLELGLDEATANCILESVRIVAEKNGRKTTLNPLVKTKLKILSDNLQANNVIALRSQIDGLDVFVSKYAHDELSRKYYLVLAALKPEKCINLHEDNQEDNYWRSFWSYIAYLKTGNTAKADEIIASMDKFADYPEDNITVLAVAGALINGNATEANEYLSAISGEYSPTLQRLVDSLYLILNPAMAAELGATEESSAFYLVNMFGQEDSKELTNKDAEARTKTKEEMCINTKDAEEQAKQTSPVFKVDKYELVFPLMGGDEIINVTCNGDWHICSEIEFGEAIKISNHELVVKVPKGKENSWGWNLNIKSGKKKIRIHIQQIPSEEEKRLLEEEKRRCEESKKNCSEEEKKSTPEIKFHKVEFVEEVGASARFRFLVELRDYEPTELWMEEGLDIKFKHHYLSNTVDEYGRYSFEFVIEYNNLIEYYNFYVYCSGRRIMEINVKIRRKIHFFSPAEYIIDEVTHKIY